MKRRSVLFSGQSRADMERIAAWVAEASSPRTAKAYISRIEAAIFRLEYASERGQVLDVRFPGLRLVGFEKRVMIAFNVQDQTVEIVRVFYGGQDWERALIGDDSAPESD